MTSPVAAPSGTTEYPACSLYEAGSAATLTMYVNDTSRMVVGWHMVNNLPYPVEVTLTQGTFSASRIFASATDTTGVVPTNSQWNYDNGGTMSYGLTPRRP